MPTHEWWSAGSFIRQTWHRLAPLFMLLQCHTLFPTQALNWAPRALASCRFQLPIWFSSAGHNEEKWSECFRLSAPHYLATWSLKFNPEVSQATAWLQKIRIRNYFGAPGTTTTWWACSQNWVLLVLLLLMAFICLTRLSILWFITCGPLNPKRCCSCLLEASQGLISLSQ